MRFPCFANCGNPMCRQGCQRAAFDNARFDEINPDGMKPEIEHRLDHIFEEGLKMRSADTESATHKAEAIFMPWRMGRKIGRTVYAQVADEPSDDDVLIGVMDSRILAADVVASHNAVLTARPDRDDGV